MGKGKQGDELPAELARRESRLKKIAEAKAALEPEARERACQEKAAAEAKLAERQRQEEERGKKFGGGPPQVPDPEQAQPEPKAQRNFTDPDSRIMLDGATKSFTQAYNVQAAVDSQGQIIVAAALTQEANDKTQLVPMLEQVAQNMGRKPEQASADAGYFSEAAVTDEKVAGMELLVPPERQKHSAGSERKPVIADMDAPAATASQSQSVGESTPRAAKSATETMRDKLRTTAGRALYKMRQAIVEPVFGQIKAVRGLRGFSMRGREKVSGMADHVSYPQLAEDVPSRAASADDPNGPITHSKSSLLGCTGPKSSFFSPISSLRCEVDTGLPCQSPPPAKGIHFIPTGS
jgi:hypothetical protein